MKKWYQNNWGMWGKRVGGKLHDNIIFMSEIPRQKYIKKLYKNDSSHDSSFTMLIAPT